MIQERLNALREVMRRERLGAFIFPSTDPHQSEYVADHWKGREYISGFNGSAGTAVVTMHSAALWTDSRYFLAAEEQLKGTEYQLMKQKIAGTPTITEWLEQECGAGAEVGIDGWCCSMNTIRQLVDELRHAGGMTLRTNMDPLAQVWQGRPVIPEHPIEIYPLEYAGESARDKISRLRQTVRLSHACGLLMTALDDIAWTLNLRGSDVHCNPVFVAYLLLTPQDVTLFINKQKVPEEVMSYLNAEGVMVDDYRHVQKALKDYLEYNILMDPDEVNQVLFKSVRCKIVEQETPVKRLKAVKNDTEIAGFRKAMVKDGIALVKFLKWLSSYIGKDNISTLTEVSIDQRLTHLRSEQPLYRGLSFDTIAGYGDHGAIVHYEATSETDIPLQPKGLLLIDSGAQYLDGTTDITRTIALGPLTDEERHIYTLVLKGHIQLELCKFPAGSTGTQLDILARQALWREGLNYLHGTGHGVGCYLNVHEGPHQIRMEWKGTPLVAGMTVTDEPGLYLPGRFGVRTENTLLVTPYMDTEFGKFLQFESLTLCPIDKTPIDAELLTEEEIAWLDNYHEHVYQMLAPHLNRDEVEWLRTACLPL